MVIDWNEEYKKVRAKKSYKAKKKQDWNARAASFAKRSLDSKFADLFVAKMNIDPDWSVLDVGCGPGTLAIPLASRVAKITALDFSTAMLAALQQQKGPDCSNITEVHGSWTDDWQNLGLDPHDVTIAARSLAVDDLKAALTKLNNWATKKVFIADRVGYGPFDPDLFAAVGRPFNPGPDFQYCFNLLLQMGITPTVEYLEFDQHRTYASFADAVEGVQWMVEDLSDSAMVKLQKYVKDRLQTNADGSVIFSRNAPVKWAFISFEVVDKL